MVVADHPCVRNRNHVRTSKTSDYRIDRFTIRDLLVRGNAKTRKGDMNHLLFVYGTIHWRNYSMSGPSAYAPEAARNVVEIVSVQCGTVCLSL